MRINANSYNQMRIVEAGMPHNILVGIINWEEGQQVEERILNLLNL